MFDNKYIYIRNILPKRQIKIIKKSMNKNDRFSVLVALLGVLLGALITFNSISVYKYIKGEVDVKYGDWKKLNLILDEVKKHYVDTVDEKSLTDAAVTAALAKLDPHSIYLPPVELEVSETELAGNFDGIGIQFNVPNDTAIVLDVISGGPSEKAGLMKGDRIIKVDEKEIAGVKFPQDSMVRRMKGPAGTKVNIIVDRDGTSIPFEILRGKIPVHSVDASFMINDTTGYIRLSKFSKSTYREVSEASQQLLSSGMKRLIFDLRDNSGGYFDQALSLSDMFLEKGEEIVYLKGRNRKKDSYKATGTGPLKNIALSVLINEGSASSSEIFSGAIQDNDRGVIVGRRSFGKGLVQEPIYFTDGSGIRITVSRFYTPSGRCIQKPYQVEDYNYDIYKRWIDGEMFEQDSIKLDSKEVYKTAAGRLVYGGGGIVPDIFVPVDTTRATAFFLKCNKKGTQMRFASMIFDKYKKELGEIDDYESLEAFLKKIDIPASFIRFASSKDGITIKQGEWKKTEPYILPQLRALISRYSKLGENAFYKLYLPVDDAVNIALTSASEVVVSSGSNAEL